jgi:quinol-cytochrome oxidoreductase complex cytochrome b subunit
VPVVGQWLLEVMRGGPDVTINTLYRFFALHVVILPLATLGLIGVHLAFIQTQGMAKAVHRADEPPRPVRPGLKFFPDFVVRDLLLWLCCLIVLAVLVYNLPYGPGVPGIEWELGKKANPLAPAYPGIKPEWYFLWIYQLLKEFPPHLFGMEGPQAALIVVSAVMGTWAFIPFLDRRAQAGKPSPMFTDLATAAIIWLSFLTLQAWDIGGHIGPGEPDPRATAWACAIITLGIGAAIVLLRALAYKGRWFILSSATLLQVVLNGLFHVDYLLAGAICLVLAAVGVVVLGKRLEPGATS